MTTFQTQQHTPHIGLPVSEDPMEVNTDMDRHFEAGEDIDIDLDLTGDLQRDEEDEYMGEDGERIIDTGPVGEQDSNTTNDDEMADDGYVEGSIAEAFSVHDEDLDDAGREPDIDEEVVVDVAVDTLSHPNLDLFDDKEYVDASGLDHNKHDNQTFDVISRGDEDYHEQLGTYESDVDTTGEVLPKGQKEAPNISHGPPHLTNQEPSLTNYERSSNRQQGTLAMSHDEAEPAIHESSQEEHDDYHDEHDESQDHRTRETVSIPPQELECATSSRTEEADIAALAKEKSVPSSNIDSETCLHNRPIASDGTFAVESIYLHPVVVVYQDNEISLFPPINQEQDEGDGEERSLPFFLDDEQLASDSMQNLWAAFRSVLGESMNEQDELTIDIEELGLHISEFSTDCSTISLKEVIDIYVQLQHYDGLDSPPPLYMNLITKARFSHRLESLLFTIAEKRGLSQTRSSYAVEEHQQLEAERETGHHAGDEPLQADVLPDRKDKRSVASQYDNTGDSHGEETAQAGPIASPTLLDKSKPASPPLKTNASAVNTKRCSDEAFTDTINRENGSAVADGPYSEVPPTDAAETAPQLVLPTEPERHGLGESVVDDDDFIDYEDDGEPAQRPLCGSSTLLGNMSDVTADRNITDAEENNSQEEPVDIQGTETIRDRTAKGEMLTHDTPHNDTDGSITETGEQGQSNFVDHHPEHLEYLGKEDNAVSLYQRSKIKENSKDVEQSSQPHNQGISPAIRSIGNREEGFDQSQLESAPLQADVYQEQQNMVNDGHDDLESTQLDNEQGPGDQSNTNRPTYDNTGSVLQNDDYQREIDDGFEYTKLAESNNTPPIDNCDIVDNFSRAGKTELQLSVDGRGHSQDDDDDEITYEDEENEEQTLMDSLPAKCKSVASPGSLKRVRSFHKDDDAIEDNLLDAKRIRSF